MNKLTWLVAAATFASSTLGAQDLSGTWQGTAVAKSGQSFRQVLKISKAAGWWRVVYYDIDQMADPVTATNTILDGQNLKMIFPSHETAPEGASYEGVLSGNTRSITGTWIQPDGRYPLNFRRVDPKDAWTLPPSHAVRLIPVDSGVKLEVLDWGGSGRPIVFLTGLGNNAHVFDFFAPKFTPKYHVYGITRRGYGESSHPVPAGNNYSADRLGDDILAVMDSLKLVRPVLVGHSIAGEEMSSIGSRHPDRVAGLVYLDAAYPYAFYNEARGDMNLDLTVLRAELQKLQGGVIDPRPIIQDLLDTSLPRFERELKETKEQFDDLPPALLNAYVASPPPDSVPRQAIISEGERYTHIPVPILAIYAEPHSTPPDFAIKDSAARAASEAADSARVEIQAQAFAAANPTVHLVRLPHADHFVFLSNEADVLRDVNAFLESLPQE